MIAAVDPLEQLRGDSPGIAAVREQVRRVLQRQAESRRMPPILVQGETGTGKGLLARALHAASLRAGGPFVDVNCAAIPETLLEAEMFGVERGAFTDARQARPGLFQLAHRGAIFLDEIGLLSEALQAKLLKAIEERAVRRLGATRSEAVDVWIIAATNEDLAGAVRSGRFRADLYHRLAVVTLTLPPLRERDDDIVGLAEHFLAAACADYGLPPRRLTGPARAALRAHPWPGNVRELSNVMERVALLAEGAEVTPAMLDLPAAAPAGEPAGPGPAPARSLEAAVEEVEREHLLRALAETGWNISRAALRLGISRNTLRYRLEKHGLRRTGAPARPAAVVRARPAPPPPPTPPPQRERRRVVLLRVTLGLPGEVVGTSQMRRLLEVAADKARSFGGRVEEVGATGLVAVFGLEPAEDSALRAAHAAMALLKGLVQARRAPGDTPALRAVIHVDHLLVRREGEVVAIDVESRPHAWAFLDLLAAAAEDNAVLVTEAAVPFLERRFSLSPVPGGPVPLLRLGWRERVAAPGAAFVGRRHDLDLLRSRYETATRGHGQVVGVAGDPGIGKSRLLIEFRRGLDEGGPAWIAGHCLSYASQVPYVPVLEMLQATAGLGEADSTAAVLDKLRRLADQLDLDPEDATPYLLHLLGMKEGSDRLDAVAPEVIRARTFELLRQLWLRRSRQQPLVLAVEDLHWIDGISEEFLASLVEALPGHRLLLLCTYRSGYRPPWIERSYASQISLQPLAPEESLEVVRALLGAAPEAAVAGPAICARAEGNPFFLEEFARAVRQRGAPGPGLPVPETVQEVLLARIGRLPPAARRLLETAAVLGADLSRRVLAAVWEGPEDLEPAARELVQQELLREATAADDAVFSFQHALVQEVAYQALDAEARQRLHRRAAAALERLYGDRLETVYGRLAYHYGRTDETERAVDYLVKFGIRASRSYAHAESAAAFQQARRRAEGPAGPDRDRFLTDLVLRETQALHFLGRLDEALELLQRERQRVDGLADPGLVALYHFWLARTLSLLGDFEQSAPHLARAREAAGRVGDDNTLGKVHFLDAYLSYWRGRPGEGLDRGRQAVALLERGGEQWWLGMAHWVVALNATVLGEFEAALVAAARAHTVAVMIDDRRLESYAAWTTGWVNATRGEWEAGLEACRRGRARASDPVNVAFAAGQLGHAHLERGEPEAAIPLLEEAVDLLGRLHVPQTRGRFMALLAEAYLATGESPRAEELARRALETSGAARFPYGVGLARRALGRIATAGGQWERAAEHLAAARETFAGLPAAFEEARTLLAEAELARARGAAADARARFLEARVRLASVPGVRLAAVLGGLAAALGLEIP